MSLTIPLQPRCNRTECSCPTLLNDSDEPICTPFWGHIPTYKYILFRFCLAVPILVFIILPLLYICWLVFASVYYIYWVTELKRRERIEAHWRKMKNKWVEICRLYIIICCYFFTISTLNSNSGVNKLRLPVTRTCWKIKVNF